MYSSEVIYHIQQWSYLPYTKVKLSTLCRSEVIYHIQILIYKLYFVLFDVKAPPGLHPLVPHPPRLWTEQSESSEKNAEQFPVVILYLSINLSFQLSK